MYIYDYWEHKDFYDVYDFTGSDATSPFVQHPVGWNTSQKAFASIKEDSPPWHTVSVRSRNRAPQVKQTTNTPDPDQPIANLWEGFRAYNITDNFHKSVYNLNDMNVKFCDGPNTTLNADIIGDPKSYTWEGVSDPSSPGDENYNVWMSNIPVAWAITETEVVVRLSSLMSFKNDPVLPQSEHYRFMDPKVQIDEDTFSGFRSVRFMNKTGESFEFDLELPLIGQGSGLPGDDGYANDAITVFDSYGIDNDKGLLANYNPFEPIFGETYRAQSWEDYFLGINDFDGQRRVFGDMVVLSVKNKETFGGFSSYGIPIVEKIGDLFTLPENDMFPAWTLDNQGRAIIQYVSRLPESNNPFQSEADFNPDKEIYTFYWPMKMPFTGEVSFEGAVIENSMTEWDIDHNPFYYGLSRYIAPMRQKIKAEYSSIFRWTLGDSGSPSWVNTTDHGWVYIGTWRGGMHNAYVEDVQTAPSVDGGQVSYLKKNENPFDDINAIWGSNLTYVSLENTIRTYDVSRKNTSDDTVLKSASTFESYECSVEQPWNDRVAKDAVIKNNPGEFLVGVSADIESFYESKNLQGDDLKYPSVEFDRRSSTGLISVGEGYGLNFNYTTEPGTIDPDNDLDLLSDIIDVEYKKNIVTAPYIDYIRGTPYGGEPSNNRDLFLNTDSFVQWNNILSYTLKNRTRSTVAPIPPHKRTIQVLIKRTLEDESVIYMNYPMFNKRRFDSHKLGALAFNGSDYKTGEDVLPFLSSTVSWTTTSAESQTLARFSQTIYGGAASDDEFQSPTGEGAGRKNDGNLDFDVEVSSDHGYHPHWQMTFGPHGMADYETRNGNFGMIRFPRLGTYPNAAGDISWNPDDSTRSRYLGGADPSTLKNTFATNRMINYMISNSPVEKTRVVVNKDRIPQGAGIFNYYLGQYATVNLRTGNSCFVGNIETFGNTETISSQTTGGKLVEYEIGETGLYGPDSLTQGQIAILYTDVPLGKPGMYTRGTMKLGQNFGLGGLDLVTPSNIGANESVAGSCLSCTDSFARGAEAGIIIQSFDGSPPVSDYEGRADLPIDLEGLCYLDTDPSQPWWTNYREVATADKPFDVEFGGELEPADELVLRVRVSGLKGGVEKEYKIADFVQPIRPSGNGYKIGFFGSGEVEPFAEWRSDLVIGDTDNNPIIDVPLSFGTVQTRVGPLDGETYAPNLGLQSSYKTNEFDLNIPQFRPVIFENLVSSGTIELDPNASSVSSGKVGFFVGNLNSFDTVDMKVSLNYPHDAISINDEFPVKLRFV